jgi:hypothetical protein
MPRRLPHRTGVGLALAFALAVAASCPGADDPVDTSRDLVLPSNLGLAPTGSDAQPTPRPDRIRLFRIVPGFLSDPVGLEDDPPSDPDFAPVKADDGPNWLQLAIGNDNQYFDVRYPGDPGGIGYTRVHSQLQLLDSQSTSCAFGLRAVMPAGAQQGGVEDGPTVVSPGFSLFHALDSGTAFQGYFSKDLHISNPANLTDSLGRASQLNRGMEYGMAVQKAVLPEDNSVFFFVEALGRYRYDQATAAQASTSSTTPAMEVLPGMHFKLSDTWWLSGSVILPVNQNQPVNAHLWQITCSFQF